MRKGKMVQRKTPRRKIFETTKSGYLSGSKKEEKIIENGDH